VSLAEARGGPPTGAPRQHSGPDTASAHPVDIVANMSRRLMDWLRDYDAVSRLEIVVRETSH
jgi:hypothetical protein